MASKDKITRSFKIIRTYFHTIREMVRDGLCKVFHIWGKYNPADLMTKSNQRQRIHGDNDQAAQLALVVLYEQALAGAESVFLANLLGSMGEWQSDLRTRLGSPFAISMLSVLIPSQGLH